MAGLVAAWLAQSMFVASCEKARVRFVSLPLVLLNTRCRLFTIEALALILPAGTHGWHHTVTNDVICIINVFLEASWYTAPSQLNVASSQLGGDQLEGQCADWAVLQHSSAGWAGHAHGASANECFYPWAEQGKHAALLKCPWYDMSWLAACPARQ